jgi:hypothetical protein
MHSPCSYDTWKLDLVAKLSDRAVCKKNWGRYRWGQVVEFEATIGKNYLIWIFIHDLGSESYEVIIQPKEFINNFVIQDGYGEKLEDPEGIHWIGLLKSCLNLA